MSKSVSAHSLVSSRYADALLDLAEAKKAVPKVHKDLTELKAMIEASEQLQLFVDSPLVSKKEQLNVIDALVKKAKFQSLTHNFLGTLIENRRLGALLNIIERFFALASQRSGEIIVQVKTAHALDKAQEKEISALLSKELGKDIVVDAKVDPSILGGMIVKVGSQMIDDSVLRKLERLKAELICEEADLEDTAAPVEKAA